jgi:hypothetical protein
MNFDATCCSETSGFLKTARYYNLLDGIFILLGTIIIIIINTRLKRRYDLETTNECVWIEIPVRDSGILRNVGTCLQEIPVPHTRYYIFRAS